MPDTPNFASSPTPAQLEQSRPRVKRRKGINSLPDSEAVQYSPQEIINATRETWRADIYGHYEPRAVFHYDNEGNFVKIVIVFDCKYNEPNHRPIMRDRLRTGDGTHNLHITAKACDERRGALARTNLAGSASILGTDCEHYNDNAIRYRFDPFLPRDASFPL